MSGKIDACLASLLRWMPGGVVLRERRVDAAMAESGLVGEGEQVTGASVGQTKTLSWH
jgi:hypothetical protein